VTELFLKKKEQKEEARVFRRVYIVGVENKDAIVSKIKEDSKEDDSPILVAFSYEPTNDDINSVLVKNNVVVAVPIMSGNIGERSVHEVLTEKIKEIIALDELSSKDVLKRYYAGELATYKLAQVMSRKENARDTVFEILENNVYRKLIIGRAKKEVHRPLGSITHNRFSSGTYTVESILMTEGYIPANYALTKDDVLLILSKLGKTCKDEVTLTPVVCKEVEVGEVWNWFQTTVEPPLNFTVLDFSGFLRGVRELYEETLSIAFVYGSGFVWKRVRDGRPDEVNDRGDWALVEDFARSMGVSIRMLKIVPYTDVVNRFFDGLKAESGVKEFNKVKKVVRIMVTYRDVVGNKVEEELERFVQKEGATTKARTAVFWKIEEYPDYVFILDVVSVEVEGQKVLLGEQIKIEPRKKISVKFKIDATEYPYEIEVKANLDNNTILRKDIPGNHVFEDTVDCVPDLPGEHSIVIEATGRDPKHYTQSKTVLVYVVGEIVEEKWVDMNGLKSILNEPIYKKVMLSGLSISDIALIQEILKGLKDIEHVHVKEARLENVEFKGIENEKTTLTISSGKLASLDDLRFVFDTLSKRLRQRAGKVEIDCEKIEDRNVIENIASTFERLGLFNTKFKVEVHREVV